MSLNLFSSPIFSEIDISPVANWPNDGFVDPPTGQQSYDNIPFKLLEGPRSIFQTRHNLIMNNPIDGNLQVNIQRPFAVHVLLVGGYVDLELKNRKVGEIILSFSNDSSLNTSIFAWQSIRESWTYESEQTVKSMIPPQNSISWKNVYAEKQFRGDQPALNYIDMVTIPIPERYISTSLRSITFRDTSLETAGSENPSLIVIGVTCESR